MKFYVICGMAMALGVAMYVGSYYRTEYTKQLGINGDQKTEIQQLTDHINDQNTHIAMLHELDAKHTQELTHAKTEIGRLRVAAERNPERVYIKAECPGPKTTAAARVDDAAPARPTDTAVRNYWLLREHIATAEQMIQGLQDYIKTQCQ